MYAKLTTCHVVLALILYYKDSGGWGSLFRLKLSVLSSSSCVYLFLMAGSYISLFNPFGLNLVSVPSLHIQ